MLLLGHLIKLKGSMEEFKGELLRLFSVFWLLEVMECRPLQPLAEPLEFKVLVVDH